jgi:ethanolamine utilization protein EutA (predicted chaperonin)
MERNAAGKVLKQRKVNLGGKSLDPTHQKTNLVFMISAIARLVNKAVGKRARQRSEFSRPELDKIEGEFNDIVSRATEEVFGAK